MDQEPLPVEETRAFIRRQLEKLLENRPDDAWIPRTGHPENTRRAIVEIGKATHDRIEQIWSEYKYGFAYAVQHLDHFLKKGDQIVPRR